MSELSAFYYDGRSPDRRAVSVRLSESGDLTVRELGAQTRFGLEQVEVRSKISNQPAVVDLPGNARLEINDAEAFFALLREVTGKRQWLHELESRGPVIAGVFLLTVFFGWFVYTQGVPGLATWVASVIPDEVSHTISQRGLQTMDRDIFVPSTLRLERQSRIRAAMEEVTRTVGGDRTYLLQFRGGDKVGANAYAFPSGLIIFTDDLVRLAESTDELRVIMAHEVGHVRNRHTLRMLMQKTLLAGLVVAITGDAAAVAGIAAALPKTLIEARYTREFEYEADTVAREYLLATGKPLTLFSDIMSRIAASVADRPEAPGLLRTHPATKERIETFLD